MVGAVRPAAAGGYVGAPVQGQPQRQGAGVNGLSIAAMVLGILWLYWIGSILAVVFGHVSLNQINRDGQAGRGFAIAGVALGWVGVGTFVIALIVFMML